MKGYIEAFPSYNIKREAHVKVAKSGNLKTAAMAFGTQKLLVLGIQCWSEQRCDAAMGQNVN